MLVLYHLKRQDGVAYLLFDFPLCLRLRIVPHNQQRGAGEPGRHQDERQQKLRPQQKAAA